MHIQGFRLKIDLIGNDSFSQRFNGLLMDHSKSLASPVAGIWSPQPINPQNYRLSNLTSGQDEHENTPDLPSSTSLNWRNNQSSQVGTDSASPTKFETPQKVLAPFRNPDTPIGNQMSIPGKNIIDLARIARGLDTRTTVMLRNIPNKVDQVGLVLARFLYLIWLTGNLQQTLKEYIDETSKGLYNFLYLRIGKNFVS